MGKNNDIKPPSNVKDLELAGQNIIQGVSLKKDECGGKDLGKIIRYFSSKDVNKTYLVLGDIGWVFTYAMMNIKSSEELGLKKKKMAEQVVELLDNSFVFEAFAKQALQLGNDWLSDKENTDEYEEYSQVKPIKTSEIPTKYPEVYRKIKDLLTKIYLSKSKDEWVIKFKQGIGENAREFCTRNEESFKNQGLAFKLSLAHSLFEAILITTLAVVKNAKYFSYPDANFHFIYPLKNLLQLEPDYKNLNILNSFCYKLPTASNLANSPKKEEVIIEQEATVAKQTIITARKKLNFFTGENGTTISTDAKVPSPQSPELSSSSGLTKDYLDEVLSFVHNLDPVKHYLLLGVLLHRLSLPIGYTQTETGYDLTQDQLLLFLRQVDDSKKVDFSSSKMKEFEKNSGSKETSIGPSETVFSPPSQTM